MSQTAAAEAEAQPPVISSSALHAPGIEPHTSLRSLALRGSVWTITGFGSSQLVRLAGNIILTRLLFPEAFGMMALVNVFLMGLELFSDIGVAPSIIQHDRGDESDFLNTAWTIQVIRGVGLTLCAALLSWPVAIWWFKKPELVPLMIVAGTSSLIMGFNSTKLATASRHMAVGRLTLLEFGTQVLGLVLTVAFALAYRSVWALVFSGLASNLVKMSLSHCFVPGPVNRFCWNHAAAVELSRFGRWIFLSTAISFLSGQADKMLLGRLFNDSVMGFYGIALTLSDVPGRLVSALCGRILYPALSRKYRSDKQRFVDVYVLARRWLNLVTQPAVGLLIVDGDLVVRLLYDHRYQSAGPMMQVLSIRIAMGSLILPGNSALTAMGHPKYATIAAACKSAALFLLIPTAFRAWGIMGPVWVMGLIEIVTWPVFVVGLRRAHVPILKEDLLGVGLCFVGMGAGLIVRWLAS